MAHRYPNQGHQPPSGMANRGIPNRNMYNQGFHQNQSITDRGRPSGPRMNNYDSYQSNLGVSNSGRPSFESHSNQGFQENQNMQNRAVSNPCMNRNQGPDQNQNVHNRDIPDSRFSNNTGYQTSRHIPNTDRRNFSSDINTSQSDQYFPNRDISNSGMTTNQGFQTGQSFPNRGASNSGMRTNQGLQMNQSLPNRGMSTPEISSNQGFQTNQGKPDAGMPSSGMSSSQGFYQNRDMGCRRVGPDQGLPNSGMSNPDMHVRSNQGFQTSQGLPNTRMSNNERNSNQGFQANQGFPSRGMPNTNTSTNQGFQSNQGFPNRGMSNTNTSTNQGFQSNQGYPNRGMSDTNTSTFQGFQSNQGFPNRGMSNTNTSTNQGFQSKQSFPNRGMSDTNTSTFQGFQSNQGFPNRGISNTNTSTNQGFQSKQAFPNRGMPDTNTSTYHGFQSNQGFPNRGMFNHEMNSNQGLPNRDIANTDMTTNQCFQSNQGLPNRGMPNTDRSTNQGFQSNQGFPNRGMSSTDTSVKPGYPQSQEMSNKGLPNSEINVNQGFHSNRSFPSRDMSYQGMPNSGINTGQGIQTNQNIPSRGAPDSVMNNLSLYNKQNYSQDTTSDSFHVSNPKPPESSLQGGNRFHMGHDAQSVGDSQGQMGSFGMQQGAVQQNTMTQAPIVQHVMIPVPVPVGTDIPPHFLRPQVITSSSQNRFPGPQNPDMQPQGQVGNNQGQFPVMQGPYQGQNQTLNMLGQRNMPETSNHGQMHAPNTNVQANSSRVNELSYYMSNESRNVKRERDHSVDSFHSSFDRDTKNDHQQRVSEEMYGNRDKNVEDFRHFDKFQNRPDECDSERLRSDRSRSHSSSKHSSYNSDYFDRPGQEIPRKSVDTQKYDKEHVYPYRKHDDYVVKDEDFLNTRQFKYKERNETFESENKFGREHKAEQHIEYEREKEYDRGRNERYDRHDSAWLSDSYRASQNVQHSDNYRNQQRLETERPSGAILYTDGNLENTRTSDFTNDFERHSDMHGYSDRNNDKPRERQLNENKQSSSSVLYKDENREYLESRGIEQYGNENREFLESRGIEQYGRDKRKQSPVPVEISVKKLKAYSPVSDNKSHGELKIHVSDSGRWIEGNSDLSPVSDCANEVEMCDVERNKDDLDSFKQNEPGYDQTSLDGAEMVSDSESYIEDLTENKVQSHDLSPVSQHSPVYETEIIEERSKDTVHPDTERVSPSRSNYSKFSDDRKSQSHKSRHSDDWQKDKRKSPEISEASGHFTDHRSLHSERKITKLNVPDLCRSHNQKGCCWDGCASLHVCKFFIIDQCKFGEHCSKGHDFFESHSYSVLSKENPGIRNSNATAEDIKAILKERILSNTPASHNKRLNSNFMSKEISPIRDTENDVVAVDPSFDARNYATGNIVDAREKLNKKKSVNESKNKSDQSHASVDKTKKEQKSIASTKEKSEKKTNRSKNVNESKYKLNDKKDTRKNDKKLKTKISKQAQKTQSKTERMLSPVSGDEDDWEKYEKYEQVSDNDMSEKEDELDNVSSDESIIEQVQVNRSVDSFPLPTPENIAVPIGMNDPLVFNRPLKNNPQSYIGPMNRPPPMFPLTGENNAPLFPVISGQNQPGFSGMPMPGQMPNYLPSPSFMKEVIKNLPPFKVEPTGKNVFKNDNNPRSEVDSPKRKIKADKVEKEPELKETIKKLWKFPHKGIINMSIIEFVTETEAYKEEFIAEIVKILVTLELPYVTMKKLMSVIKEKVAINVKSETDMRKILEMYPNNFKMMEMVDSDDENDDLDAKKNVQIKANIGVGFCEKHGFLPFALGKCECNALHLCKFYFLSDCPVKLCKFGHKLKTDHNIAVLKQHKLHRLTGEEILNFLADIDNRNKETIPSICKYYIREKGCYKGDNIDFETICHNLHLCAYILKGKCMNRECDRSHSIHDKQPLSLLKKYGLDPDELGDEKVFLMLGEKCIESDKVKRVNPGKQNQVSKSSSRSKSSALAKDYKTSTGDSRSAGEGLVILSHSETRLSSKYFVQNFKVPAVCKFYQNALGCRKKDWGAAGKCFFLHICQHYVKGDCNYGDKCKRSHDLFSGQAAEILEKYNFDLDNLTSSEILKRLNSNSGAPVELPTAGKTLNLDSENIEMTIDSVGEPDEIDLSNFEVSKHAEEEETYLPSAEKNDFSNVQEGKQKELNIPKGSSSSGAKSTSYTSGNVEDVIKHIMEHNKVNKK